MRAIQYGFDPAKDDDISVLTFREGIAITGMLYGETANYVYSALAKQSRFAHRDEMVGWQPIETAPKDGSRILIVWDGETRLGWWREFKKPHAYTKDGVWDVPSLETVPMGCEPTRWMPLPTPPARHENGRR